MLIKALHREIGLNGGCGVLSELFRAQYFFVLAFVAFTSIAAMCFLALTAEQLYNMVTNMTLNERKNYSHYYWMTDTDGSMCNKFDRGWFINTLEFWHFPGLKIDYTNIFELPTPTERSRYSLTQENIHANIMRYSNSNQAQLLPTQDPLRNDKGLAMETLHHQKSDRTVMYTNSSRAGPPSLDLEMMHSDSRDSGDTHGTNAV